MTDIEIGLTIIFSIGFTAFIAFQVWYYRYRKRAKLASIEEICSLEELVSYYVEPDGQNINPADYRDDDSGIISTTPIFQLLDKFLVGNKQFRHAFILSDAGMGKSSLLAMLKYKHILKITHNKFNIKLLKLGRTTLQHVDKIPEPSNTVLLLDALDEDPEAWDNFSNRIGTILRATQNFRKIIISCRTQFFPHEHEGRGNFPGMMSLHGFYCAKLYLSPFDNKKVDLYLEKRFRNKNELFKAKSITNKMNFLQFRPMLLANIDLLIDQDSNYETAFAVYQTMVDVWLNREASKGDTNPLISVDEKKILESACLTISQYLFDAKELLISQKALEELLDNEQFNSISSIKVGGRSLLNRTSDGHFKFSHLSIMEYLITTSIFQGWCPKNRRYTDQIKLFVVDVLAHRKKTKIAGSQLPEISLPSINLSYTSLDIHDLEGANLERANLERTSLENTKLTEANLKGTNLKGAILEGAILNGTKLERANMEGTNLKEANLEGASLDGVNLRNANLKGASLEKTSLKGANLEGAILDGAMINDTEFSESINLTQSQISSAYITDQQHRVRNLPTGWKQPPLRP